CIYFLFVFANKNFCDLTDGDGTMIEVALVTSFALLPYVMTSFLNIIFSNVFILREQAFMNIISTIGLMWSLLIGIVGLKSIHRYSFGKTALTVIITLVFMALIAFLCALIFLISQQLILFFKDIYSEIVFRL
ncbi:MAG: YIP1 family protein, partial [Oscillospiraceae bacterium]|nr:YIP1 family protein [Oscillospiraceae bacterium]